MEQKHFGLRSLSPALRNLWLLLFIMASLEIVFGRKNYRAQKVHLAVTFSKIRLDILYILGGVLFSLFHSEYLYSFIFFENLLVFVTFSFPVNCRETLRDVLQILRNTGNPQVEYIIRTMKKWAKENRIPVS